MNIQILDSWLKEYLRSPAKANEIAKNLSLTSVSVERVTEWDHDHIYDIEITTNRPDLMSVVGLAREAAAVLPEFGIEAKFVEPKIPENKSSNLPDLELPIKFDPKIINRICAVALDVTLKDSPDYIKNRLTAAGINPHNNLIDVTNYVMRELGHPMHAFDYDKLLKFGTFTIREAKTGEKIIDLHNDEHELKGGDIVAVDEKNEIIDLLAVIGTENTAVDSNTKRVLLFVDNDDANHIRKTSMSLGIRTDAAILNEKGVDPELAYLALLRGVELLARIADAKVISKIYDEYPNKFATKTVSVTEEKINSVMGVEVPLTQSEKILKDLGFEVKIEGKTIHAKVPSWRASDVEIPEDLIEEVARVYGYFKLPSVLPYEPTQTPYQQTLDQFYWEKRAREALKYWGFTEVYTYPMVSEDLLEEAPDNSVTIKNPLTEDHVYMRRTLVPSLLEAVRENKNRTDLKLFELANIYIKKPKSLPNEQLRLAGVYRCEKADFLKVKGIIEALLSDLGIKDLDFKPTKSGAVGADVYIGKNFVGEIEVLERDLIDFELDFDLILKHVSQSKIYKPTSKFPEAYEDLRFEIDETIPFSKITKVIKEQSKLVRRVELLDVYQNKKTFRIVYQSEEKNLTANDIKEVREKIISALAKSFKAKLA